MPFYPKVLQAKECAPTLYFSVIFTSYSHLIISRSLGARQVAWEQLHVKMKFKI